MYYAHRRDDGKMQTLEEHLQGTAKRSGAFAAAFGAEAWGQLLGYAHDLGKASEAFQKRLLGGPKVDHATAGALECKKKNLDLMGCCIAGHHSGLPDYGSPRIDMAGTPTYVGRIKKGEAGGIPHYSWQGGLPMPGEMPGFTDWYPLSLWLRMLFSCLVDGDYLDTEAFMLDGTVRRDGYDSLPVLLERLKAYIAPWFPPQNALNASRCEILRQCMEGGGNPAGLFTLTVPTGGGKTVASLAFALKHALKNGLQRVIYVVPYTSIIEQNAAVFREILGENNVVEHHSGLDWDGEEETDSQNQFQRLASENWDAPVIVTTAVQFFESLYANRPSKCRKLHNIAGSVVIFDEAQMIPTGHLLPCVGAIANLVAHFRATVVLCTATQPVLSDLVTDFVPGLQARELCPGADDYARRFCRVTYRDGGALTHRELAARLEQHSQVLCILNTRKAAQEVLALLPEAGSYHLSTLMYPAHRKAVLREVADRLEKGLPCRVVSTSLVEAGVDMDFPCVYREMAGLDSIAQAAGRCNRNGKRPVEESIVTYFRGEEPVPLLQKTRVQAAREALAGGGEPADPVVMERYFTGLRKWIGKATDKSRAVEHLRYGYKGCLLPFARVAEDFHLIDQATSVVYIPLEEGEELSRRLLSGTADRDTYRKAGQYGVSVYQGHFRALLEAGDIVPLSEDSAVLENMELYREKTGLSLHSDWGKGEFI